MTYEYAGRVAASRQVEVRARVGGILLSRTFDEGSRVNKGDVLFRIDPATYEADVAKAKAQVLQAQAQLGQAQRTEERARQLARQGASSQATLDDAVSARELAEAQVAAAQAQERSAELSLDYATVVAPVAGITSLEQVPEGSLLSTGALLTKITQLDPIYVNFSAADTEAASIRQLVESGALSGAKSADDLTVQVMFGDGQAYPRAGKIDFTSTSIDPDTGTILSRAVLPNPDSRLLPGQFVRLKLKGLSIDNAIVIPTEALMQGPQGTFVYVVGDDKVATVRPIEVGRELDGRIVVSKGLSGGDTVVVKGVVKVRPDSPVNPVADLGKDGSGEAKPKGETDRDGAPAKTAPSSPPPSETSSAQPKKPAGGAAASPAKAEGTKGAEPSQASTADERSSREPPVPTTALPDGDVARRATKDGDARAELDR